jgi:hypothetical protein
MDMRVLVAQGTPTRGTGSSRISFTKPAFHDSISWSVFSKNLPIAGNQKSC